MNTGLVCILRYGPLCSCRPNHVFAITISPSAARRASRWLGSCENNTKTLFARPIGIGVQLSSAFGVCHFQKNVSNFLRSGRLFRMFHHSLTQFCVPRILTWESGPLRHNTKGFHGFLAGLLHKRLRRLEFDRVSQHHLPRIPLIFTACCQWKESVDLACGSAHTPFVNCGVGTYLIA